MRIERRFVFRGTAAAASGIIIRPAAEPIEVGGACSLTVAGGRSRGALGQTRLGQFASLESAETSAIGEFADPKLALELSHHNVAADSVDTTTLVWADVVGVRVGEKPVLHIGHLHVRLEGRSPGASGEASIRPTGLQIDNVDIDGHRLEVVLDSRVFSVHDTKAKLLAAAEEPPLEVDHASAFLRTDVSHERRDRRPLFRAEDTIYGTVVRELRWAAEPYADSRIDGHVVVIPEFGTIYFGEIFVTSSSRRLTMVRLELGSPIGGAMALAEVETNGAWYPP
jgi:hypothetical protein